MGASQCAEPRRPGRSRRPRPARVVCTAEVCPALTTGRPPSRDRPRRRAGGLRPSWSNSRPSTSVRFWARSPNKSSNQRRRTRLAATLEGLWPGGPASTDADRVVGGQQHHVVQTETHRYLGQRGQYCAGLVAWPSSPLSGSVKMPGAVHPEMGVQASTVVETGEEMFANAAHPAR